MMQRDLTTAQALHLAVEMLDRIAQGKSYDRAEYYEKLHGIRLAEKRAKAEEILVNPADREPLTEYTAIIRKQQASHAAAGISPADLDAAATFSEQYGEQGEPAQLTSMRPAGKAGMTWHEQRQAVAAAIAEFPVEFGLRAFQGDVFSISTTGSYISDFPAPGTIYLYTCRKTEGGGWDPHSKGTPAELRRQIVERKDYGANNTTNTGEDGLLPALS